MVSERTLREAELLAIHWLAGIAEAVSDPGLHSIQTLHLTNLLEVAHRCSYRIENIAHFALAGLDEPIRAKRLRADILFIQEMMDRHGAWIVKAQTHLPDNTIIQALLQALA